ncbi:glycosyltransferase family 2 protein [Balneola sp. MJW-20]|uniref:glycosyltransferase family 2 protein n=1 Tax=Gracilimonas aurantiaca TaxID=3234185 RepID=UPI0034659A71
MQGFSIIIVSWNALHYLKEYLPSVAETNYDQFEIILADNNSEDGSAEWVEQNYPDIKVARLDKNYGYCGGNNRAVPYSKYDKLIFLNNDVKVDENWLTALEHAFDEPDVAAAQPKLRAIEHPDHFEYAGAAGGFMDKYGFPFCQGRVFDHVEKDEGQYEMARDIFWASGAALAIRKELFTGSGGFDEDFEFHMEEIDLCWRLQNLGYRIRYAPGSIVYHLGGGSLPMGSPRKVYYNFRNSLFMLWKNYSAASLLIRLPIRLKMDVLAAYKALFSGNPKEWWAIARAHLHFVASLGKMNKKRKVLKNKRIHGSDPENMYNVSVVWRYFIGGKKTFSEIVPETAIEQVSQ